MVRKASRAKSRLEPLSSVEIQPELLFSYAGRGKEKLAYVFSFTRRADR